MASLEGLAAARHPLPNWAVFAELRAGTGFKGSGRNNAQRFDVAAFHCWPSKRGQRVVYEMKRTRSDFLRELDSPEKRAQAEDFFHETWFVTSRGVCEKDEVPDGWGLLVATKKGDALRQVKRARPREPSPVPYEMILSVLRRASEQLSRQPTFDFDGREVTAEALEAIVRDRVSAQLEHLRATQASTEEARKELCRARLQLQRPLEDLARMAGDLPRFGRVELEQLAQSISAMSIEQLVTRAARRKVERIADTVRQAREELDRVECALREADRD